MNRFYVTAFGKFFCLVNGWVDSPENVHGGPVREEIARIVKDVQPGVTLVEVSV